MSSAKKDDIEARADEVRKKVLNFKPQHLPVREEIGERGEMHYYIPVSSAETIEMVDHRRRRSSFPKDALMTLVIVGLFVGGLYGGRTLFLPKKMATSPVVRAVSGDDHAAKSRPVVINEPVAAAAPIDSTLLTAVANSKSLNARKTPDSNRISRRTTIIKRPSVENDVAASVAEAPAGNANAENKKADTDLVREIKPVSIGDEIAKDDNSDKKHGLFKKLFGKKKKDREEN